MQPSSIANGSKGNYNYIPHTESYQSTAHQHSAQLNSKNKDYYLTRSNNIYGSPEASFLSKGLNDQTKSPHDLKHSSYSNRDYNALKNSGLGYSTAKEYMPDPQVQRQIEMLKREYSAKSHTPYSYNPVNTSGSTKTSLSSTQPLSSSLYTSAYQTSSEYANPKGIADLLSAESKAILYGSLGSKGYTTQPISSTLSSAYPTASGLRNSGISQPYSSTTDSHLGLLLPKSIYSQSSSTSYPLKKSLIDPALEAKVHKITDDILHRSNSPQTFKDYKQLSSSPIVSRYDPMKNSQLSPLLHSKYEQNLVLETRVPERLVANTEITTTNINPLGPLLGLNDNGSQIISSSNLTTTHKPAEIKDPVIQKPKAGSNTKKQGFAAKILSKLSRKKNKPAPVTPTFITTKKARKPILKRYQPQLVCFLAITLYLLFIIYVKP